MGYCNMHGLRTNHYDRELSSVYEGMQYPLVYSVTVPVSIARGNLSERVYISIPSRVQYAVIEERIARAIPTHVPH